MSDPRKSAAVTLPMAPPDAWALLSEPEQVRTWIASGASILIAPDETLRNGSTIDWERQVGPIRLAPHVVVRDVVAPTTLTVQGFVARISYRLSLAPEGAGTRLLVERLPMSNKLLRYLLMPSEIVQPRDAFAESTARRILDAATAQSASTTAAQATPIR